MIGLIMGQIFLMLYWFGQKSHHQLHNYIFCKKSSKIMLFILMLKQYLISESEDFENLPTK